MKTAKEIEGDVWRMLKGSPLAGMLTGGVYRSGMRPRDSRVEDAVVTFTMGLPTQIEVGTVTINIYVPDIAPYGAGIMVEDAERTEELSRAAADWVAGLNGPSSYYFELQQTIHSVKDRDLDFHRIVIILDYKYFDNN